MQQFQEGQIYTKADILSFCYALLGNVKVFKALQIGAVVKMGEKKPYNILNTIYGSAVFTLVL